MAYYVTLQEPLAHMRSLENQAHWHTGHKTQLHAINALDKIEIISKGILASIAASLSSERVVGVLPNIVTVLQDTQLFVLDA